MTAIIKYKRRFKQYSRKVKQSTKNAMQDVLDDLVRTSSQSAPHDEGILEKSWSKEVKMSGDTTKGFVSYTVNAVGGDGGKFNYALKMHEEEYNLGKKSEEKTGGVGMSGKSYSVGTGYLGDVLKGETDTYSKYIEKVIRDASNNF